MRRQLCSSMLALLVTGCLLPGAHVKKNPGDHDRGIRYYRPKPYLLLAPLEKSRDGEASDRFVTITLEYLPDFSEEYSLHVTPGLGSADVEITLDQGWNLTSLNQNYDSRVDDNVKAVADLVSGVVRTAADGGGTGPPRLTVEATNVPLGFYEAVVSRTPDGKKQLYGWRYVGFAPFNACPTHMCGGQVAACGDPWGPVYGLVFANGVMSFRPLHELEAPNGAHPAPGSPRVTSGSASAVLPSYPQEAAVSALQAQLQQLLPAQEDVMQFFGGQARVAIFVDTAQRRLHIQVHHAIPDTTRRGRGEAAVAALPATQAVLQALGGESAQLHFSYP